MDFWQTFVGEFSLPKLAAAAVLAGVEVGLMWSYGKPMARRQLFYVLLVVFNFSVILVASSMLASPEPRPDFDPTTIEALTIGQVGPGSDTIAEGSPAVTLTVVLRNTGISSAIERSRVDVVFATGQRVTGTLVGSGRLILRDGSSVQRSATRLNPSTPVTTGSIVPVVVVAAFPDVQVAEVNRAGARVVFSFVDSFGTAYSVEEVVDGIAKPM